MTYIINPYYPINQSIYPYQVRDFSPISINFKSYLRNNQGEEVPAVTTSGKARYSLRIHPPRSSKRGIDQYIPDIRDIPLRSDGIFRYELAPSTLFYPHGRYIVEYYRLGRQTPIDVQEWAIPPVLLSSTLSFVYDSQDMELLLPYNVWNVTSIEPSVEYVNSYNRFKFIAGSLPPRGARFTISYEPSLTLGEILEYTRTNLRGVSRIRE